jgi:CRP/FNR family nitrogen fixation transcriptional regulator
MFDRSIETASKQPVVEWRNLAPRAAPLFDCAPEILGTSCTYDHDEEIYCEGDATEFIYRIVSGSVRTTKIMRDGRRQIGGFYLPDEFFGLGLGKRHHLTAEAVTGSKILLFKRRQIEIMARLNMGGAREMWLMTAGHLRLAEEHLLLLGRKTALERLASFVIEMDSRLGNRGLFELPMSRRDIADYLGLTFETISRGFSALQKQRALELTGARHVVVRNRAYLCALGASRSNSRTNRKAACAASGTSV